MTTRSLCKTPRLKHIGRAVLLTCLGSLVCYAQTNSGAVRIVKPAVSETWAANLPVGVKSTLANAPENFYHFGAVNAGDTTNVQRFTVEFAAGATLTKISSTPDFKVEPESSCAEGRYYQAESSCVLIVRFTPQGPGSRIGTLSVSHDQSTVKTTVGLGGYGYAPAVSFIPALISNVAATGTATAGLLSGAQNISAVGDRLAIADTGNGLVRSIDSSGVATTLASGYVGLLGVTEDTFGQIYFDVPSTGKMYEIYDYGPVVQASGAGTAGCPVSAPCTLSSEALGAPGEMSIDPYNHLFFVDSHQGAAFSTVQPIPANLIFLYDPFPYQQSPSAAMAVDSGDNLYSLWANGGVCEIVQQSLYNAENSNVAFNKIAGGHTCGFSGDGGQATNAEIGNKVGQIAFDLAGNLYFTDQANQRVRRIDYTTGIIRTIAGTGVVGDIGDGGLATKARLATPTGVAVDSLGQVYVATNAGATGTGAGQVVRVIGVTGSQAFASRAVGSLSGALTVLVSNTGNSSLTITNTVMGGANPTDFAVDPGTTSCLLTAGSTLYSGQSCQIGFTFNPGAVGARSATFTILDNTTAMSNVIKLTGSGVAAAGIKLTSPAANSSLSTSTVSVKANITYTGTHVPTGTANIKVDGVLKATTKLVSATASATVSGLLPGTHTLWVGYSGDSYNSSATASEKFTVVAAATAQKTTGNASIQTAALGKSEK